MTEIQSPEVKARIDFEDGGNQSYNPYPKDSNPNSNYSRYSWEMHRLASIAFKKYTKERIM